MFFIKKLWNFLSSISGVIATIIYLIAGIKFIWINIVKINNIWLTLLLFLVFIIALISTLRQLYIPLKKLIRLKNDWSTNKEISEYTEQAISLEPQKIIPSESLIKKLDQEITNKIKDWAEDTKIISLSMHISIKDGQPDIKLQARCFSQWKQEEITIFTSSSFEIIGEIFGEHYAYLPTTIPFYKSYPTWRKAMMRAYESVKDRLPKDFTIAAQSHYNNVFHFEFNYKIGKVDKAEPFELDKQNSLTNLRTGKTVILN